MKRFCTFLTLLGFVLTSYLGQAQTRYLDEVFTEVQVTDTVTYGVNVSILPIILGQSATPLPVPLKMDVYQPVGDTASQRALIIFGITGTFFPAYVNGGFTGELKDSTNVAFATRMAKRGYVVAVVQYRRGWNAIGSEIDQQKTILQAAYRGIQDIRNAVRYFRKTSAEDGNPWKVDVDHIAVGGTGTGGYMSYGATYLKSFDQILLQKFIDFDEDPPAPFVDTLLLGDVYGVKPGLINVPNFPTYSSDFNVGFALGGALGDSSWVDKGDVPFISAHSYKDPAAPPRVGDVLAVNPSTGEPFAVIPSASGGYGVIQRSVALGNQAVLDDVDWWAFPFDTFVGEISTRAEAIDEGNTGLYPFITPYTPGDAMCLGVGVPGDTLVEWTSPWNWYNEVVGAGTWDAVFAAQIAAGQQMTGAQAVCRNNRGAPNDPAAAKMYVDTIVSYISSRIGVVMDLFPVRTVGIEDYIQDENLQVYPNPAQDLMIVNYRDNAKLIKEITLMDFTGRSIRTYNNLNRSQAEISRDGLPTGVYLLRIKVDKSYTMKKVIFN